MTSTYMGLKPKLLESAKFEATARLKRGVEEFSSAKNLVTVCRYSETLDRYLSQLEDRKMENQNLQQGSYTMGVGVTRNMGNYESLNLTIHVTLPILVEPSNQESVQQSCLEARQLIESVIETHLPQMITDGCSAFRIPLS